MPALNELPDPNESAAWLITYASGFNKKHVADQPTETLWVSMLGRFDPNIIQKGIESHYRSDRRRFLLEVGDLVAWCASAAPPPPQCTRGHVGQREGFCGECRAERLVAGTEKMIGSSTVPPRRDSTPMPDYLRAAIGATKRP